MTRQAKLPACSGPLKVALPLWLSWVVKVTVSIKHCRTQPTPPVTALGLTLTQWAFSGLPLLCQLLSSFVGPHCESSGGSAGLGSVAELGTLPGHCSMPSGGCVLRQARSGRTATASSVVWESTVTGFVKSVSKSFSRIEPVLYGPRASRSFP